MCSVMNVFVSYTSRDPAVNRESLEQVERKIRAFANVFIDLLHNEEGMQLRVDWELHGCDVVLQLVSPRYKSEWVQKEVDTARKIGKRVIKMRLEEVIGMEEEELYGMMREGEKNPAKNHRDVHG